MDIFNSIYRHHLWGGASRSGTGSDLPSTASIREQLPPLIERYHIQSILDLPCGDYYWFKDMHLPKRIRYIGADVVPAIIVDNQTRHPKIDFRVMDITRDPLPEVDLLLARDLFGHFSQQDFKKALFNLRGPHYLLATTFPKGVPQEIETGQWYPINMELTLGPPLELLAEDYPGKYLGLWELPI